MMIRTRFAAFALGSLSVLFAACGAGDGQSGEDTRLAASPLLLVYASHNAAEVASILDDYRSETGQRFQLLTDDMAESETRLGNPRLMPEADVFLGASLAELWAVAEADALRPQFSDELNAAVPEQLRDSESRWFALSTRARVIAYNTNRLGAEQLDTVQSYESLRDGSFEGQLCVSSSAVPGNKALVAFLIGQHDVREADVIVREWRANLAMTVFTNDGTLLNAIADGRCGIGIVDSSILAAFLSVNNAAPVAPHWFGDPANTLIDISAAGVTRHAKNPQGAVEFLQWLTTNGPNAQFATSKFEFPVSPGSPAGESIADWSEHMPQVYSLSALGFLLEEADRLIERARYP